MKNQFRKGFRQNSKAGFHDVRTIKLGTDKILIVDEIYTKPKNTTPTKSNKTNLDIKTVKET